MSFPVVTLDSIPPHGLVVPVGPWARVAAEHALGGALDVVEGELRVSRVGRDIEVRGEVHGHGKVPCDRCGEPVELDVTPAVSCLYLAPRADDEAPPEYDVEEFGEYDGVALDLAHVVGESLSLERPLRVLCADLDPEADAACLARYRARSDQSPRPPDPRLAALKGFKPAR